MGNVEGLKPITHIIRGYMVKQSVVWPNLLRLFEAIKEKNGEGSRLYFDDDMVATHAALLDGSSLALLPDRRKVAPDTCLVGQDLPSHNSLFHRFRPKGSRELYHTEN